MSVVCISSAFLLALCRKSKWSRSLTELSFHTIHWKQYPVSLSSRDVSFRPCCDIREYCPLGGTYLGSVRSTAAILWRVHCHSSEVAVRDVSLCSCMSICYTGHTPSCSVCLCRVVLLAWVSGRVWPCATEISPHQTAGCRRCFPK